LHNYTTIFFTLSEDKTYNINTLTEVSFEFIFKSSFKGLCYFAQRYVKDLDTAKEIVQEAFINLWEKRDSIDLSKSVNSYLTTTIYNRSLNYLRDNKKFNKDILTFENLYSFNNQDTGDKLVAAEINLKINKAIEELPEKCREVFHLSRFENLKYRQIANKLNISIKTVETQMSKALQHMRIRLVDYIT